MKYPMLWLSLVSAFSTSALASGESVEGVEIPAVPGELLKEKASTRLETLKVPPGNNVVIPIALGHLNRLVLPFEQPEIRTVNPATTQIEGHVLYVAPTDENPISLYVTPGGSEELALSLTLAPQHIPPREIHLTVDPQTYRRIQAQKTTEPLAASRRTAPPVSLEPRSQDPISELKHLFRGLALGQTPEGFTLRSPQKGESIHCDQKHLRIKTGQVLEGRDLKVYVGVIQNGGPNPLDLNESNCLFRQDIVAVAAWPDLHLDPRHSSELYVALRPSFTVPIIERPSLLGGIKP